MAARLLAARVAWQDFGRQPENPSAQACHRVAATPSLTVTKQLARPEDDQLADIERSWNISIFFSLLQLSINWRSQKTKNAEIQIHQARYKNLWK